MASVRSIYNSQEVAWIAEGILTVFGSDLKYYWLTYRKIAAMCKIHIRYVFWPLAGK